MAQYNVLVDINLNKNRLLNTKLEALPIHPSGLTSNDIGYVYYNTTNSTVYTFTNINGNEWLDLGQIYIHPTTPMNDLPSVPLTGTNVISQLIIVNGHVQNIVTRDISNDIIELIIDNDNISNNTTWSSGKIEEEINIALTGALQYKGAYNPIDNIPDILTDINIKTGFTYVISINGTFLGEDVEVGDMIIAIVNNPGSTLENWQIVNKNIPTIVDASEINKGIIQIATNVETLSGTDNTKAITPAKLKYVLDNTVGGYSEIIGDNIETEYEIIHNLNTSNVLVQIYDTIDGNIIMAEIEINDNNSIIVRFSNPPTINQYRVIIKK